MFCFRWINRGLLFRRSLKTAKASYRHAWHKNVSRMPGMSSLSPICQHEQNAIDVLICPAYDRREGKCPDRCGERRVAGHLSIASNVCGRRCSLFGPLGAIRPESDTGSPGTPTMGRRIKLSARREPARPRSRDCPGVLFAPAAYCPCTGAYSDFSKLAINSFIPNLAGVGDVGGPYLVGGSGSVRHWRSPVPSPSGSTLSAPARPPG